MENREISVFGATGLIGGHILEILEKDSYYNKINVITRRSFSLKSNKVNIHVIDFSKKKLISKIIKNSNIVIASIGTTKHKVNGNKDNYRKIDYDILLNIAKSCKVNNIDNFSFVSSCGANIESKNFYLNLKAEIENAVLDLDLNSTSIFRPSLLLGKRKESRFGENIAQIIMPLISFMMPSIYKPIKAKDVAKAIIQISKKTISGVKIYHYDEMINSKEI